MNKKHYPTPPGLLNHEDRIFILHGWDNKQKFVVLTEKLTTVGKVRDAWTHAVRYTASGLDLPNHEAAMKMLIERHPSWQIIESICPNIHVDLAEASEDIPEA